MRMMPMAVHTTIPCATALDLIMAKQNMHRKRTKPNKAKVICTSTYSLSKKNDDDTVVPGLQNEQLILILIDRLQKLNTRFPARENALAITKLEECLHWLQHRVQARMQRGVMGDLKK